MGRSIAPFAAALVAVASGCSTTRVVAPESARADLKLPSVISSHMVLQQQSDVAIWGTAAAGEAITVAASWPGAQAAKTTAAADGRWRVNLKTPVAGGPYVVEIAGQDPKQGHRLEDVLIGEVWLCGGQSNMEWAFAYGGVLNAESERAAANDPQIRFFDAPNVVAAAPQSDCAATWTACTSDSVNGFSCIGYFFARELRKALKVPVGLIGVNWGGTVAQAWVSKEALAPFPRFADELKWVDSEAKSPGGAAQRKAQAWVEWFAKLDAADAGSKAGFAKPGCDDSKWSDTTLPGVWSGDAANFDGVGWYRRTITLPAALAGADLRLTTGPIDDMDTVWLDGTKIGGTEQPGAWTQPRSYVIPAALATAGSHVLAIRVVDTGGAGGMNGPGNGFALSKGAAKSDVFVLSGAWKFTTTLAASAFPTAPVASAELHPNVASVLFNGLVSPVLSFGVRGALWYQGESNRGFAAEYSDLMPVLIADWRARFERPELPFLFVQIAPYNYDLTCAATAELRQAQSETLRVANTGMVVTTDIGDPGNIHPANKQEVARRLSLWALAKSYGKDVGEVSGPLFESMAVEGGAIRVHFTHTGGGLVAKGGGALTDFEICGADGKWFPAQAKIDGATVLVSNGAVPEPKEVRFAFSDSPSPNLFNGAGLPASPFCKIARVETTAMASERPRGADCRGRHFFASGFGSSFPANSFLLNFQ